MPRQEHILTLRGLVASAIAAGAIVAILLYLYVPKQRQPPIVDQPEKLEVAQPPPTKENEELKPSVVFVISNGYRGPITLVVNEYTGTNVSLHDGAYVYHIPASGLLAIKSMAPFERWHQLTARYEDGTAIPVYAFEKLPADTVVLYSFGTESVDHKTSLPHYLGTVKEAEEYSRTRR